MDWFKKHVDTVIILTAFAGCLLWMNGKFNDIDRRFSEVDKEIAVMKTIMIMKNIMPIELATKGE